jgi:hypothetical protein
MANCNFGMSRSQQKTDVFKEFKTLAFSGKSVINVPLWSLITGLIFLFPFRLLTYT